MDPAILIGSHFFYVSLNLPSPSLCFFGFFLLAITLAAVIDAVFVKETGSFVLKSFQQSGFCDYSPMMSFKMLICPLPFL